MKLTSLSLISILSVCACAAPGPTFTAKLSDAPTLSGGSYSTGGGITVAADLREMDGRTLVCGVWAQSLQQSVLSKGTAPRVMATGGIDLNGKRILRNLRFMEQVTPMSDYALQKATCRLTDLPWQASYAGKNLDIRFPKHLVNHEIDDLGGGILVYFEPTGPGAGG